MDPIFPPRFASFAMHDKDFAILLPCNFITRPTIVVVWGQELSNRNSNFYSFGTKVASRGPLFQYPHSTMVSPFSLCFVLHESFMSPQSGRMKLVQNLFALQDLHKHCKIFYKPFLENPRVFMVLVKSSLCLFESFESLGVIWSFLESLEVSGSLLESLGVS